VGGAVDLGFRAGVTGVACVTGVAQEAEMGVLHARRLCKDPTRRCHLRRSPMLVAQPDRASRLMDLLATVPDPRDPRGVRYPLAGVLAVAVTAVLAGARSFAAIGEWAADLPGQDLARIRLSSSPDESTLRKLFAGGRRPARPGPRGVAVDPQRRAARSAGDRPGRQDRPRRSHRDEDRTAPGRRSRPPTEPYSGRSPPPRRATKSQRYETCSRVSTSPAPSSPSMRCTPRARPPSPSPARAGTTY